MMKLDLIIPAYNNKRGLYRSLLSLGTEVSDLIDVTIVDDASDEDYTSIINFFQQFFPIRLLRLNVNSGPGMARQYGIDHTRNEYFMFLDCGDYYITPDYIPIIYNTVVNNPEIELFSWGHQESAFGHFGSHHNRMHGKVYKRSIIKQYNICFNPQGSYANEDIGFNMAVKMIIRQRMKNNQQELLFYDDTSVIMWDNHDPSITRKDNNVFYYSIQNMALAINGGWALDIASKANVDLDLRTHQIYEIMCDMYFKYLSTIAVRDQYTDQALQGAIQFYWLYFRQFATYNIADLMKMYYDTLVQYLSDVNDPIRTKFIALDLPEFLNILENSKSKLTEN